MGGRVPWNVPRVRVSLAFLLALPLPILLGVGMAGVGGGSPVHAAPLSSGVAVLSSSGGGGGSPGPVISAFTATPTQVTIPATIEFRVNASGGTPPLAYSYSGLPKGCASKNTSSLTCSPSAATSTNVTVTVRDSSGQDAQAVVPIVVLPATAGPMLFGLPAWEVSALLAGIAAVVAGLLLFRYRGRKPGAKVPSVAANPNVPKGPAG